MFKREYCPVTRNSVRWPCTVLLKGIAPKLVAAEFVVLVERKMFSKSTKPPGVNSAAPIRNESGDSGTFSCISLATALVVAVGLVCRAASSTCGVLAVFASSALSSVSIRCCCWAICCCCWAMASRNAFNSAATDVGSDGAFCAVVWAQTNPGASTSKQILATHLIEALSLLLKWFLHVFRECLHAPDFPSSGAKALRTPLC